MVVVATARSIAELIGDSDLLMIGGKLSSEKSISVGIRLVFHVRVDLAVVVL